MPKTPSPAVQRRRLNRLRWMIALSLMTPGVSLADNGLQAATGIAGTPLITDQHGVPVIDIVAPNASGLSHNQFLDYNVNKPGLVLNNALQAGQSQLAGALAANPQFQGQAASTILSEVISRNASRIEGPRKSSADRPITSWPTPMASPSTVAASSTPPAQAFWSARPNLKTSASNTSIPAPPMARWRYSTLARATAPEPSS